MNCKEVLECSCKNCYKKLYKEFSCSCKMCNNKYYSSKKLNDIKNCNKFKFLINRFEILNYIDAVEDLDIINYDISCIPVQKYDNENITLLISYLLNLISILKNKFSKCVVSILIYEIIYRSVMLVVNSRKFGVTIKSKLVELSDDSMIANISKKFSQENVINNFLKNYDLFYKDKISIFIKVQGVKCLKLEVHKILKVKTLKRIIFDNQKIYKKESVIALNNKVLDNETLLKDLNLDESSMLYFFVK